MGHALERAGRTGSRTAHTKLRENPYETTLGPQLQSPMLQERQKQKKKKKEREREREKFGIK